MKHCMLDIETLGQEPGCVILSMGAVKFNPESMRFSGEVEEETAFYHNISIDSCDDLGMHVCPETVEWWAKQDQTAKDALKDYQEPIRDVLIDFQAWYRGCEHIWSHGMNFDIPIMRKAFQLCDLKCPWHYRDERDTRTLFAVAPGYRNIMHRIFEPLKGPKHHAMWDAVTQAYWVIRAYDCIRGTYREQETIRQANL